MTGSNGWNAVALKELLRLTRRAVTVEDDTTYEQVTVRIKGRGLISRGTATGSAIATKRQFEVRAGDLLVSRIDARNGGLGLVPAALEGAIVSGDFPTYVVDASQVLPEYLELYVKRPAFWDECLLVSEGSTNRVRLVPEQFLELEIELPPADVQTRIVAATAALRRAISARQRERAAADTAMRATREHLLATEDEWEDVPEGWRTATLEEVADIRSGITKGRKTTGDLRPVPFIRAANVQGGWLDLSVIKTLEVSDAEVARFRLQTGDVLMTEGGNAEHVGRGWLWEDAVPEAVAQNHVFRVRVRDTETLDARFLAYAIGARPAREYCLSCAKKTTNLASINKSQVSELRVPIPPLDEQQRVVQKLDALRALGGRADQLVQTLEDFRAALVEDLVTGVRPPPKAA